MQDGGNPPNILVDSRTVNVMVVHEPPVFAQPVYAVTQPEGDYSTEVTNRQTNKQTLSYSSYRSLCLNSVLNFVWQCMQRSRS